MKRYLGWIFYLLFSVCFSLVIAVLLFHNTQYPYKTAYVLPCVLICLAMLVLVYRGLAKCEGILERHYGWILGIFLFAMALLQITFGAMLRFTPVFDMGAIFDGAIEWLQTGTFASQYEYMSYFPNNLGSMAFLNLFFWIASWFGVQDFFMVGVVINSLLCVAAMGTTSLICKKILSTKHSIFVLVLFAVSLPFYFIAAAFYTDALSLLFPVLVYLLYLYAREENKVGKRVFLYCAMSLVAAVGMLIKFTVVIAVIAVVIDMMFRGDYRRLLLRLGIIAMAIGIFLMSFNLYIYSKHLDPAQAKKLNTPYGHWVMMGLSGIGAYNPQDYVFTRSLDPQERNAKINQEIINRIQTRGYGGMFELWVTKSNRCFGDGTYALSDFLDDGPKDSNALQNFVFYGGNHYEQYSNITASVLISIYILMTVYALSLLFTKKRQRESYLVPFLAVFGCWLFLMMWESNGRYFTNFIPMIFICATIGVDTFSNGLSRMGRAVRKNLSK